MDHSHVNALNHYQGIPRIITPDNCKTAVITPKYYEPVINSAYWELAQHYGFAIIPARSWKPKDKPVIEYSVGWLETWLLGKLRNQFFFSFAELNSAISGHIRELSLREFKQREGSRYSEFIKVDKPALRPLPPHKYEVADVVKRKVGDNYHLKCCAMHSRWNDKATQFLNALQKESDVRKKTVLTLALFTGLRRAELCGLAWNDIDFIGGKVNVRRTSQHIQGQGIIETSTKTKSSTRSIRVSSFVTDQLEEYKRWWIDYRFSLGDLWNGDQDRERLFIKCDGRPLFPSTVNYWLTKFLDRNNLPYFTPHALRHTFATLQLANGVDIRTLQSRTGHAQASTLLNVYAHAIESAEDRATQVLDDVLLPALKKA